MRLAELWSAVKMAHYAASWPEALWLLGKLPELEAARLSSQNLCLSLTQLYPVSRFAFYNHYEGSGGTSAIKHGGSPHAEPIKDRREPTPVTAQPQLCTGPGPRQPAGELGWVGGWVGGRRSSRPGSEPSPPSGISATRSLTLSTSLHLFPPLLNGRLSENELHGHRAQQVSRQ